MKYGFEIIDVVSVVGVACLMLALFVVWHKVALLLFNVQPPFDTAKRNQYLRLILASLSIFAVLALVAYGAALSPLLGLHPLMLSLGVYGVVVCIATLRALMQNSSVRQYIAEITFSGLVIMGGAALFTFWPS